MLELLMLFAARLNYLFLPSHRQNHDLLKGIQLCRFLRVPSWRNGLKKEDAIPQALDIGMPTAVYGYWPHFPVQETRLSGCFRSVSVRDDPSILRSGSMLPSIFSSLQTCTSSGTSPRLFWSLLSGSILPCFPAMSSSTRALRDLFCS